MKMNFSEKQLEELKELKAALPHFLHEVVNLNVKLNEFQYDYILNRMIVSEVYELDYEEFMYSVKTCLDHSDDMYVDVIKFGNAFESTKGNPFRSIKFNTTNGTFLYARFKSDSPKELVYKSLMRAVKSYEDIPFDDFQLQFAEADDAEKLKELINKYFANHKIE